jgi:hypothetical protein
MYAQSTTGQNAEPAPERVQTSPSIILGRAGDRVLSNQRLFAIRLLARNADEYAISMFASSQEKSFPFRHMCARVSLLAITSTLSVPVGYIVLPQRHILTRQLGIKSPKPNPTYPG